MGVERSVTRWYLQRQTILSEINLLEAQVAQIQHYDDAESEPVSSGNVPVADLANLLQQLEQCRGRLNTLGPCPKPMMG